MIKVVIFDIGDTLFFTSSAVEKTIKQMPDLKKLNSFGYNFSKKDYLKARKFLEKEFQQLSEKQKNSSKGAIFSYLLMQGLGVKPS